MQVAIKKVENGESARSVAADLCLSHVTLCRRVKNQQYDIQMPDTGRKLSNETEAYICDWIVAEEASGRAPTSRQIRAFVRLLLQQQGRPTNIGDRWLRRFRKRHEEVIKAKKNRLIPF
jgi:hypothetical protein